MVKSAKKKFFSFGLLELKIAVLVFFEKKGHGPLGINKVLIEH
jgi:hypothetical protein